MKKLSILALPCLLFLSDLHAQEKFRLTGTITDEANDPLIGATVHLMETFSGNITNLLGQYEIRNIEPGNYTLVTSVIGYAPDTSLISVTQDMERSIQLTETAFDLAEVEIVADRITERTAISNISFDRKTLETSQGLTEDPVRTLAMLPGVGRAGDLFSPSQIYVRGGAPDENLFLMDNNKIYFPWYFGGQKSIFNTDVIESVELLTGGYNAAYGNHMSSVMNVQTRDGSFLDYKGNVSIGFYNSSATLEGPIVNERLSFLISVRRTYLDLFLDESAEFPVPRWGDVTYKLSYVINPNHKLTVSGLSSDEGLDFLTDDPDPGLPNKLQTSAKNHFQSLQLKSSFGSKFYNKLSITNGLNISESDIGETIYLDIKGWQSGLRDDFTWFISNNHKIKTGIEWQYGSLDFTGNTPLDPLQTDPNDTTIDIRDWDSHLKGEVIRSAYAMYDGSAFDRLGINIGLRLDQNPGGYTDVSPRLAANYQLTDNSKIRAATGIYHQFPGNEGDDLTSSRAIHYILGYEYRFSESIYGWIEGYHKDYQDLIYYNEDLNYTNDGEGTARGIELLLRKEAGNLRGWVSYALAHSERRAPFLDEITDFEFDQRHIFNLVAEYSLPRKEFQFYLPSLLQVNFRYTDGTPYTPVIGATNDGSGWRQVQGTPLSERNSDYLNLNIRVEWDVPFPGNIRAKSFVETWNTTNHQNILGRSYQYGTQFENNVEEQPYYATPFLIGGGFKIWFGG